MPYKDKNKKRENAKRYYALNKEIINKKQSEYYKKNREYILNKVKEYRINNKDKINEYWKSRHGKEIKRKKDKRYHEKNKEKNNERRRRYYNTRNGKKNIQRTNTMRDRKLGFIPINEPFENSHAHHLDNKYVMYIPKDIHIKYNGYGTELHRLLVLNELYIKNIIL